MLSPTFCQPGGFPSLCNTLISYLWWHRDKLKKISIGCNSLPACLALTTWLLSSCCCSCSFISLSLLLRQVACHPQCLPEHPALQSDGPPPPALPMLLNFQQRFSHLLGLRRHCVVSTQLDGHGDLVLSASTSGKIALHDFAMLRESSSCAV